MKDAHRFAAAGGLFLAVCLVAGFARCGTPCQAIQADRAAFLQRSATQDKPHLIISLPFALLERMLAPQLASLKGVAVQLPSLGRWGSWLGDLRLALRRIALQPARPDHVGFRLEFDLAWQHEALVTLFLDTEVRPEVRPNRQQLVVAVRPDSLRAVRPQLTAGAAERLTGALTKRLPPAVRLILDPKDVARAVSSALGYLVENLYSLVRDNILGHLGPLTTLRFGLPDLPLARWQIRSTAAPVAALHLEVFTTLPVRQGLSAAPSQRPDAQFADMLRVQLAGSTVAELANWMLARSQPPLRFTRQGKTDPAGPFQAGLDWQQGPRPLKIVLWQTATPCLRVRLGATPELTLGPDDLRLDVKDGTIEQVQGPALIEAGAWFYALWADAIRLNRHVASQLRFHLAGRSWQARLVDFRQQPDRFWLGLNLQADPAAPQGRKSGPDPDGRK